MRKHILIVDDDASIGDILQMMLEDAGYTVEVQISGQNIHTMQEPFPDLLFLDIRVSGMDGRAICQYLKSQDATRHIPIILLSANKDTRHMAQDAGADDFLTKPFEMQDLLALAAKYLGVA
jgi:DNA-binding response OmpR family regulator